MICKSVIVHPMPTWYRMELFDKLYREIGTKVLLTEPQSLPTYDNNGLLLPKLAKDIFIKSYPKVFLRGPHDLVIKFNPELINWLGAFDVIVWGDYVTSLNAGFIPILKSKGKKIVFWLDEWGFDKTFLRKSIDPFVKSMIRLGDAYVAHGSKHMHYLQGLGVDRDRIFLSGNASYVAVDSTSYSQALEIRDSIKSDLVLLYVGGLIARKRPEWALDAIVHLKQRGINASLILVGSGKELSSLKKNCENMKIKDRVLFAGWKDHSDLAPYYLASDIFVFPAINEPWGLVINEAMQFGLPVVSSDLVGAADMIVSGQNGFIFSNNSEREFLTDIEILSTNDSLRKMMGARSLEMVKQFSYKRMVESFENAIRACSP